MVDYLIIFIVINFLTYHAGKISKHDYNVDLKLLVFSLANFLGIAFIASLISYKKDFISSFKKYINFLLLN